ncbi:hypothetical protein AAFF_G00417120 [Aldrovandia affinis]|uniref:Reverse transcriptase n=1 Tax=Aldrovandia affinis TaxID=143900 RepID=A0AAD7R0K6_9TELE|nr:hypothetical protein AAFF_G00156340 [Aldrovandia affinis]KAJ8399045.1 hypothetical protein AAFF_G00417120 [Aldrovandia affinis]
MPCYMEDILIYGRMREEHEQWLAEVFRAISASGIKLIEQKWRLNQSKLICVGHRISHEGVVDLEAPQDIAGLRRILGMINDLCRYLPSGSTVLQPLNNLLLSDVAWL